jgi:mycofactocin precursor
MRERITPAPVEAEPETIAAESSQPPVPEPSLVAEEPLVEDDLLVEDVSIDGMCGVY